MKGNFQVRFLEGGGPVTVRSHSAWLRVASFIIHHSSFCIRRFRVALMSYWPVCGQAAYIISCNLGLPFPLYLIRG
jgi:hypothetical protein